ncbi:nitronate monooxygenase, partial [bacterium]|nr:nitronate monooxygenase [bacterium]
MNLQTMPELRIGDLVVEKPIIQGGMGVGISLSGLASAVANEGGIGVISSVGIGWLMPEFADKQREANKLALIQEIRKARQLTNGVLGLNIMVVLTDFDDLLKIAFDEKIDVVFLGAGLPLKLPKTLSLDELKQSSTKVGVIVSSGRAAQLIFRYWQKSFNHVPDVVVVEGPMAGGHLGFKKEQIDDPDYALENIIPDVIAALKPYEEHFNKQIPVIAAGGIFSGADVKKYLDMGVQGVQMATRFVATDECDASEEFKQTYVNCEKEDLSIIASPVGLPGRAIRNSFLDEVAAGERKPFKCPWKCLKTCDYKKSPYCIALALMQAQRGILKEGFAFAGSNAWQVTDIVPVKEVFHRLA